MTIRRVCLGVERNCCVVSAVTRNVRFVQSVWEKELVLEISLGVGVCWGPFPVSIGKETFGYELGVQDLRGPGSLAAEFL